MFRTIFSLVCTFAAGYLACSCVQAFKEERKRKPFIGVDLAREPDKAGYHVIRVRGEPIRPPVWPETLPHDNDLYMDFSREPPNWFGN